MHIPLGTRDYSRLLHWFPLTSYGLSFTCNRDSQPSRCLLWCRPYYFQFSRESTEVQKGSLFWPNFPAIKSSNPFFSQMPDFPPLSPTNEKSFDFYSPWLHASEKRALPSRLLEKARRRCSFASVRQQCFGVTFPPFTGTIYALFPK